MLIRIKNHGFFDVTIPCHLAAIDNLLKGFGERKHILIANKSFLSEKVAALAEIGSLSRGFAVEAARSQFEYGPLTRELGIIIEIDFSIKANTFSWSIQEEKNIFSASPHFFQDSHSIQKARVICENPSDADFYEIIANFFSKEINPHGFLPLSYEAVNGGGGSTRDTFNRKVNNNELVLCLLDNDKKHPNSPNGGTSKAFEDVGNNTTGFVKIIETHEIECLIPLDIIREVAGENGLNAQQRKTLDFWDDIVKINESSKDYFDHKNGLNLKDVLELDRKYRPYWRDILLQSDSLVGNICLQSGKCNCPNSCFKADGYGDGLLPLTVNHIKYGNIHAFKPKLSPVMKDKWENLGRLFFSWCCSPVKKARV